MHFVSSSTLYSDAWYEYPLNINNDDSQNHGFLQKANSRVLMNLFSNKTGSLKKSAFIRAKEELKKILEVVRDRGEDKASDKDSGIEDNFSLSQEIEDAYYDQTDMFCRLKMERDMELLKIYQASRAMKLLKMKKRYDSLEEVLIERILLESSIRQKIILEKIQNLGYSEVKKNPCEHLGKLTISNIRLPMNNETSNFEEYYILKLRIADKLYFWETQKAIDNILSFPNSITLDELESNFNINLEIYRIVLKAPFSPHLKKKFNTFNKVCKISFDDIHTLHHEEKLVFQTSFQLVGELNITNGALINKKLKHTLNKVPDNCHLKGEISFNLTVEEVDINTNLSMFLTMGKMQRGQIFWERKWVVQHGVAFKIYNYPTEEDFAKSLYCFNISKNTNLIENDPMCPRKRSFSLSRFSSSDCGEKLFFMADNMQDFKESTGQIGRVLESLKTWNI